LGYNFSNWNAINAQHHIVTKFNKFVSIRTVVRVFHQQKLTLQRPRAIPAKGDVEKQQAFFNTLQLKIQQAKPKDRFFFFDACSVQRSASLTRMWWKIGEQPAIKICGGRERVHILGVLDFTGSKARFQFSETLGAKGFLMLLRGLLTTYPDEKLYVVLDNARAHHAKIVQEYVKRYKDRIELVFLPPYSPKLNPIEKFWQYLREMVTHNTYFEDFEKFKRIITEFLLTFKNSKKKN